MADILGRLRAAFDEAGIKTSRCEEAYNDEPCFTIYDGIATDSNANYLIHFTDLNGGIDVTVEPI